MLRITVLGDEFYNEETERFSTVGDVVLELEHSLVAVSKWESKHQKPFLAPGVKTNEEIFDYVRCMILTPDYPPEVFARLSSTNLSDINAYIESPQSATTVHELAQKKGRAETITAELIYFWMIGFKIPFECEKWHLNRLFALIRISNVKNSKPKKMSKAEIAQRNRELNAQRKAQLGTTG